MTQRVPVIQLTGADDPFYYGLARRVGENRETIAFGEKFPMGGSTCPASLDQVPVEVISLWSSAVERATAPAAIARLHHLLFDRGEGNRTARTTPHRCCSSPNRPTPRGYRYKPWIASIGVKA